MKKPPQELIDAFLKWYDSNPHSKNEDYYRETITRNRSVRVGHEFIKLPGPQPVESPSSLCQNISKLAVHIPLFNKEVESK